MVGFRPRLTNEDRKKLSDQLRVPTVRVVATTEDYKKVLSHNGIGFQEDINQSVEWPMDGFTQRRIDEGAVKIVDHKEEQARQAQAAKAEEHKESQKRKSPDSA